METKSLDIDFINKNQLLQLLKSSQEETLELEKGEEKKTEEQAAKKNEDAGEDAPVIAEEEIVVPLSRDSIDADGIVEIETIKSAVPIEKISREEVNRKFGAIVKTLKADLNTRSKSIREKVDLQKNEQTSEIRVRNVKTIVKDNQELFKEKQIEAKWKHFPMSRAMRQEYMPKVDAVIRSRWKLPYEMEPALEARVELVVSKTGKILEYSIVETSEDRFFNHAVIQVLKDLYQLPPLPEGFSGESTEIGLRFTSK
ncbi:TonB C-terminal domain-containing protein [bacterium]|nr:TonB C-terminal domain-containing protein [bacterium]